MAVQELEVHSFHAQDLSDNGCHNIKFDNKHGYLWIFIQGTPRTEPCFGHIDATNLDT